MDVFEAIKGRRSCRNFKTTPVEREKVLKMLEAATYAPSPVNKQPWEFIVVTNPAYNRQLYENADKTREKLALRSGWKWLPTFNVEFIMQAPVLIVVVGDPSRNGAEQFLDNPSQGYLQACCAAIQNLQLAAYAQGLATLWFSLYEKDDVRDLFKVAADKDPIAVMCVGYPEHIGSAPPRKPLETKVSYIE